MKRYTIYTTATYASLMNIRTFLMRSPKINATACIADNFFSIVSELPINELRDELQTRAGGNMVLVLEMTDRMSASKIPVELMNWFENTKPFLSGEHY